METIKIRINNTEYPLRVTMEEAINLAREIAINKRKVAILYALDNKLQWVHLGTYNPTIDGFITYTDRERREHRVPCCDAQPHLPAFNY